MTSFKILSAAAILSMMTAPPLAYAGTDSGANASCAQRYRSYDPGSGTFLGHDGHRHPCG